MTAVKCLIFFTLPVTQGGKETSQWGGGYMRVHQSMNRLSCCKWSELDCSALLCRCNYSFNDPAMERQCGRKKKKKGRKKYALRAQQASTQSALLPSGDLCILWPAGSSLPTVWKEKVDGRRGESRAGCTSEKVKGVGWGGGARRPTQGNKPVSAKTRAWGERRAESAKDS